MIIEDAVEKLKESGMSESTAKSLNDLLKDEEIAVSTKILLLNIITGTQITSNGVVRMVSEKLNRIEMKLNTVLAGQNKGDEL